MSTRIGGPAFAAPLDIPAAVGARVRIEVGSVIALANGMGIAASGIDEAVKEDRGAAVGVSPAPFAMAVPDPFISVVLLVQGQVGSSSEQGFVSQQPWKPFAQT